MHDGMQYDPIQGQGHEPLKVGNPSIFKRYLLCHFSKRQRITLRLLYAIGRPSVVCLSVVCL